MASPERRPLSEYVYLQDLAEEWGIPLNKLIEGGWRDELEICVIPEKSWMIIPGYIDLDPDHSHYTDAEGKEKSQLEKLNPKFLDDEKRVKYRSKSPLPLPPRQIEKFLARNPVNVQYVWEDKGDPNNVGNIECPDEDREIGIHRLVIAQTEQERFRRVQRKLFGGTVNDQDFRRIRNPNHPGHAYELNIAIDAWLAVCDSYRSNLTPRQKLQKWLKENHPNLGSNARNRIVGICNFKKGGGRKKKKLEP